MCLPRRRDSLPKPEAAAGQLHARQLTGSTKAATPSPSNPGSARRSPREPSRTGKGTIDGVADRTHRSHRSPCRAAVVARAAEK